MKKMILAICFFCAPFAYAERPMDYIKDTSEVSLVPKPPVGIITIVDLENPDLSEMCDVRDITITYHDIYPPTDYYVEVLNCQYQFEWEEKQSKEY